MLPGILETQHRLLYLKSKYIFIFILKYIVRGYPTKHHVQVIMEVKEDKVDKFLELIPGLFFGSQVHRISMAS